MKTFLRVQQCEDRLAPAAAIDSAPETYAWTLVNHLRQNPAAFADSLHGLVNGTVDAALGYSKADPVVSDLQAMVNRASYPANYPAALALMRSTPAAGPLAWDETAERRAGVHVEWMKANGFAHTGSTGPRNAIPGFASNNSAPTDTWGYGPPTYQSWGENIGWAVGSLSASKAAYNSGGLTLTGLQQRAAFLDTVAYILELNSGGLGHLQSLLGRDSGSSASLPSFNVMGADSDLYEAPALYETQDGVPEAWLSTHRFGLYRPNGTGGFAAGVVYQDANTNGFFDAGEGAVVTVDIRDAAGRGVTDTLTPSDHGAFSEYLANGTYTVRVSANGALLATRAISISNNNAWTGIAVSGLDRPTVTGPAGTQGRLRPTVTWAPTAGATAYQVRIDDLSASVSNLFPTAATTDVSWSPPSDLVSGRNYSVLVRALRGTAPGPWSSPAAFSIAMPTVTGPTATVGTLRPTLTWNGVPGATYLVRVNDPAAGLRDIFPGAVTTATSWTVPADLASGRLYRWQVRAVNADGFGAWTPLAAFSVARPTPTGPGNGVGAMRPAFTWTPIHGATGYQVRVNDTSAGQWGIFTGQTSDPIWSPPTSLISGRTYTWQVRAMNAAGLGGWSPVARFTLARAVAIGPGGTVGGLRPTFTWAGLAGSTTYQVRVDNLTTGQTNVFLPTVSMDQAWTPGTDLTRGHTYRWWVRAMTPGPNGSWYGAWSLPKDFQVV
jgi:hypothetical protein